MIMGKDDGFATFISDDLPGFESLNGSAFFDTAHDWNDSFSNDSYSNSNPANEGDLDDGFEIVRSAQQLTQVKEVFFFESEDDKGIEDEALDAMDQLLASKAAGEGRVPRSSRRRNGERPKGDKKKPSDGRRKLRRTKTEQKEEDKSDKGAQMRRVKTAQGTTRTMRRPSSKRPEKRGERINGGGLDLGAKLNKLEPTPTNAKLLSRRSSNRELGGSDEYSVVSRGVQSTAGASVGRRDARRRRATQGQALLARNLQHYDLAGADEEIIKKTSQPLKIDGRRRQRRQTHSSIAT